MSMEARTVRRGRPLVLIGLILLVHGFTAGSLQGLTAAGHGAATSDGTGEKTLQEELAAIWNDPVFMKQFVAGYGVNAEIEPRVSVEEVKFLEKIRPLMAENLPRAEEALRKQMKEEDASAQLDFTLGGIQFQQDQFGPALASYQRAVAKFPSFRRAWRNIGLIQVRNGDYEAGISAFTKMIELGGGDAYSYGLLGFAHAAREDYQPAEAAYRLALLLQPENTEWRLGLTRCVFKQEKFEDAVALLDALIERYPDNAEFWMLQARTFIGMDQPLRAAENLEAVDRLGKATQDSLYTLGDIYVGAELLDLAASAYLRALELETGPSLERALRSASVLAAHGGVPQARQLATHLRAVGGEGADGAAAAIEMEETDRRALLKLDARLSMAEGAGTAETARILEEIVALDPLDGEALILLGQHHFRQNEPDRAIFYYERAESIEAFEVNAKIHHAQVLVTMGRYADAIPLLRRAQELRPREEIARYLEQVERIAKSRR
jgi:tetratricopeptide (TPR) repeat protein